MLPYSGGYSHAPDELTYGVDMKHIRWCGILQVRYHTNFLNKRQKYMHMPESDFSLLLQRIALAYLVLAIIEIATKDARVQDQSSSGFSIFRLYFSQWYVYKP